VEVFAVQGPAGATHLAIAARAGVPPATTSCYFSSIGELLEEARRMFTAERVEELKTLSRTLTAEHASTASLASGVAASLTYAPRALALAHVELYLQASRQPALRKAAERTLATFEEAAETALRAAGAQRPREGARAFVALADGFMLHRLARPEEEPDPAELQAALRALFIAYAMDERETAEWERRLEAARK
jgi:DNA-binding transcriptional regulator YbjK